MFKLIGWLIKISLFAAVVLVLGSLVEWRGHTVSDQVKTGLAHAERAAGGTTDVMSRFKNWAEDLVGKTEPPKRRRPGRESGRESDRMSDSYNEDIPRSERQKLKALIRELNGSKQD